MTTDCYTLYGVEASYYAAKTRCYLFAQRHSVSERSNVIGVRSMRLSSRESVYAVVPVVITPQNETLQDSAEIIDILEPRHPSPSMIPATPRRTVRCVFLMELYADEWAQGPRATLSMVL